jgi:O-antigen ligase
VRSRIKHRGPRFERGAEIVLAILLVAAFLSIQALIGGTRLLCAFPAYGLLAVAGVLAPFLLRKAKPAPDQVCLWSAVLFFGYVLLRAVFSPVPYLARFDIYSVLAGLVVYFITSCLLTSARARMWILACLLIAAMAHVLVGAIQFRTGDNFMPIPFLQRFDYGRRASGFYTSPNHLAGLLEVVGIFGLSITCWSRWPVWAKLLTGYAAGICYVGVILTGSRGGYLSAAASLVVFGVFSLDILRAAGSTLLVRIGGPALIAGVLALTVFFSLVHKSDFLTDRASKVIDNTDIRLDYWQAAIPQWKLSPFIGTGSRTYLYYGRKYRVERVQLDAVYVHNDYLQLLSEYGIAGVAAFFVFLTAHLRRGWWNARRLGRKRIVVSHNLASNTMALNLGALGAVSAYVVHSVFDFNLHIPANVLLLAFVFGILANPGTTQGSLESSSAKNPILWPGLLFALAAILGVQTWRLAPGEYYTERARIAVRDVRPFEAISYALKACEYEKQNPALYYYLGRAHILAGDNQRDPEAAASCYGAALTALARARELAPLDETYMLELAFAYDALQRFPEAEWMYYEARAFDPKSVSTQQYYEAHLTRWKTTGSPQSMDAAPRGR